MKKIITGWSSAHQCQPTLCISRRHFGSHGPFLRWVFNKWDLIGRAKKPNKTNNQIQDKTWEAISRTVRWLIPCVSTGAPSSTHGFLQKNQFQMSPRLLPPSLKLCLALPQRWVSVTRCDQRCGKWHLCTHGELTPSPATPRLSPLTAATCQPHHSHPLCHTLPWHRDYPSLGWDTLLGHLAPKPAPEAALCWVMRSDRALQTPECLSCVLLIERGTNIGA